MPRHVALLRGIDLGRLAMADRRVIVSDLGHTEVRTHLTSSTIVFTTAAERNPADLARELETAIAAKSGLGVPVIVREGHDLSRIVAANPFPGGAADHTTLHVAFLAELPAPERVAAQAGAEKGPNDYRVAGKKVYLHCLNRLTGATFMPDRLDRALDVGVTMRNWRTVTARQRSDRRGPGTGKPAH